MLQAVESLTIMPDGLSSGIYAEITAPEGSRMEAVHFRLERIANLIGLLVNSNDVPDSAGDLLMIIHDLVEGCRLLTGDEARLVNALPTGMHPLWSRPSYAEMKA